MKVLLLFLAMPLIEVAAFVKIGGQIGAFWTIVLTVFTAFLGAFLVRTQGIRTLFNVKDQLAHGQLPAVAVVEGIILLVCGALLLTPGFISDTLGFLGLIPVIRTALASRIMTRVMVNQMGGHSVFGQDTETPHNAGATKGQHTTIEGQFTREK